MRIDGSKRFWLFGVAVAAIFGLLMACDEDPVDEDLDDNGTTFPLQVTDIIASPKAGGPGDTLLLSAIVTSTQPNENESPTMQWTASGGAFLETNQSSVRWVAPNTGGIYTVIATATNSVSTAKDTADVFVGAGNVVVASQAGAIQLQSNQTDIYYLHTPVALVGTEVYSVVGGVDDDAVETPPVLDGVNNRQVVYSRDLTFEVHAADSLPPGGAERIPVRVIIGDLITKTYQLISVNVAQGTRHSLNFAPDIAADNRSIAYTGVLPPVVSTDADSFEIYVFDKIAGTRRKVTQTHPEHRNMFPTWSTDQNWLTYISDRISNFRWELYAMRVNAGVIDTDDADVVRMTDTGGSLGSGTAGSFGKPLMTWNPVVPTLALRATDNLLYLVTTNATGATQIEITTFANDAPSEMVWAPDGSELALTTGTEIHTLALDGSSIKRLGPRGADSFADVQWSPDSRYLMYRATRAGDAWFEVIDLNGPLPLVPLSVTASEPTGVGLINLNLYRGVMSMNPAWGTSNVAYYPTFATGAGTPGIMSVDLSGILP
jgi:hypothetical protein